MAWPHHWNHWFDSPAPPVAKPGDPVGDHLRAAVSEHARVKADNIRCYEARVQTLIADLFARMRDGPARHDA